MLPAVLLLMALLLMLTRHPRVDFLPDYRICCSATSVVGGGLLHRRRHPRQQHGSRQAPIPIQSGR